MSLIAAGTRNGLSGQTWRGINVTSKGNHWRYTVDRLEELDVKGDIYWPPKGGLPRLKMYAENAKGSLAQDWWDNIPPINSQAAERLGYPTQKPLALLELIIYVVICPKHGLLPFEPDTPEWFVWLAEQSSFRFVGKVGYFSAHHEWRVKKGAWRAHRQIRNQGYHLRLAPSQELTIAVLEQAAEALQAHLW